MQDVDGINDVVSPAGSRRPEDPLFQLTREDGVNGVHGDDGTPLVDRPTKPVAQDLGDPQELRRDLPEGERGVLRLKVNDRSSPAFAENPEGVGSKVSAGGIG